MSEKLCLNRIFKIDGGIHDLAMQLLHESEEMIREFSRRGYDFNKDRLHFTMSVRLFRKVGSYCLTMPGSGFEYDCTSNRKTLFGIPVILERDDNMYDSCGYLHLYYDKPEYIPYFKCSVTKEMAKMVEEGKMRFNVKPWSLGVDIKDVIFNSPAVIVMWSDGSKTVVKAENEEFDPEKGLAMCIAKKVLGNKGNYYNEFKKWLPKEVE